MSTPAKNEALLKQTMELLNEEKYHDVINLLTDELLMQQWNAALYNARAKAHEALNQFKEQLKYLDYSKSTEINSKNIVAYNNVIIAKPEGDTRAPEAVIREMLANDPNSPDNNFIMGFAFENLGFKKEAEQCYRKAIEINPNNSNYQNHLGFLLQCNGNIIEAEHCYKKAIEINSNDAEAYYRLGVMHEYKGNTIEAETCFKKAIEIKPDDYVSYERLGGIFFKSGNEKKAFEYFTTATFYNNKLATSYLNLSSIDIEINPNASRHFNRAVYLFLQEKNYEHLMFCIKRALSLDMPMIIYRIMSLLPLEKWKRFESYFIDIQENINQAKFFSLLIEIWRTQTKNPEKSLLSEAIINFYLGDAANAYNLFHEELYSEEVGLNLCGQYYFCLSAMEIMEEEDAILNAAVNQADLKFSGDQEISLLERYYGSLIFYLNGNYEEAISILNSLFPLNSLLPKFRPAGYKLAEIYDNLSKKNGKEELRTINKDYTKEKEKIIAAIRLEESQNPLYQFGMETIKPNIDSEKFLDDIMPVVHLMEIQGMIGDIFLKPFDIRSAFYNVIQLTDVDNNKENLSLKDKATKAWQQVIESEIDEEELNDLFAAYRNFKHPSIKLGELIQNGAKAELLDSKEKHQNPVRFNFKLYLALNYKLYNSGSIHLEEALHVNNYIYICMDALPVFKDIEAKQYLLNCIRDYFLEGSIPYIGYGQQIIHIIEILKREAKGKQSPILNFDEFIKVYKQLADESNT